jgi:hypothetical protein
VETVYAVTSLEHRAADPGLLAGGCTGTGRFRIRVLHVRDVTRREDASRIRTGNGPHVMAALRNTATNLARLAGHDDIVAAGHPTASTEALSAA